MLILKKEFLKEIIAQCKAEFPNEACGILAGKASSASKVFEMKNIDNSPQSYFMDAKEQLNVIKEIRQSGLEMIGIYHSHVANEARPSSHDIEMAFYPEASYVIVSLKNMDNPSVRAFKIKEGKVSEEEIIIR